MSEIKEEGVTIRHLKIPNKLNRSIKDENLDINELKRSNARRSDGETTEGTMINLLQEAIDLRTAIRKNKTKAPVKVTILGKTYSLTEK